MERIFSGFFIHSLSKVDIWTVCMCAMVVKSRFYSNNVLWMATPGDIIVFWYAVNVSFCGYFQRILLIVVLANSWDAFNEISLAPKKKTFSLLPCHHKNITAHVSLCQLEIHIHISDQVTILCAWPFLSDVSNIGPWIRKSRPIQQQSRWSFKIGYALKALE